ncbi:hypothetical protein FB561_0042 [Kribbella amoyensis]|uniref:Uncharacterized protein n=1 Tax=Kribbella amoyensis TaxID=996641 RepID=A0A561BJF4_9ACTN|nr:hypothetical protein [Kribbella amoyensis]TWD78994.1 hypothetical protein FB561_0042 [Kribbella amoyensis]
MLPTVIAILVGAALLALSVYAGARRRRRFDARAAVALRAGWRTMPVDPALAEAGNRIFAPGAAEHQVGADGFQAVDFTYSASRTSTAAKCHLVSIRLPAPLPPLAVVADNPIARGLGVPDLELESAEFNEAFWVNCEDARYASAVLQPRLMEWMLAHRSLQWRIEGSLLVTWGPGHWTVGGVTSAVVGLNGVRDRIPAFVLADYRVNG